MRHSSLQHTYSTPSTSNKVQTTESIVIASNLFYLPAVLKESELYFISYQTEQKIVKETVCSFNLKSKQWRNREVVTTSNSNQKAFSLLYGEQLAILRAMSIDDQSASVKITICKLKHPSSWEVIPFTSESVTPVDLKNCQCVQSTRHIVLVSVCQSKIIFYMHHYSSQWSKVSVSLPALNTSYQLQCYLFTYHGKPTAVKVVENKDMADSCSLEFCPLSDAATGNIFRKEYSFIMKLLSVIPLHSATYYNHVLIVYYDSISERSYLEIFSLI